jgi:crotonobetainyl-CoA:carnitine CoA-transferase CaiB-like acyl-CoA transferase
MADNDIGRIGMSPYFLSMNANKRSRVGSSIVDLSTAMMAAFAIASALYRRMVTGEGQHVDVAIFDTALALMAPMANVWINTDRAPERLGNGSPAYVPTADSFPVNGGEILIAALTERHRQGICTAINRPELPADPRFAATAARRANAAVLRDLLIESFASANAAVWEQRLSAAGVPAAPVLELQDALNHQQLAYRNIISKLPGAPGIDREIALSGSGFTAGSDGPEVKVPPPAKGQHTGDVLREAGYSMAEIDILRAERVV